MIQVWLIEYGFLMLAAALGIALGWWLRGRNAAPLAAKQGAAPRSRADRKNLAEQAFQGLHAAAETVRSCVEQHIECIQAIEAELHEASATQPAIISSAADSIIAANGLVQHQFNDIQQILDHKQEEIQEHLADPYGLLITFASLDRQKHVYRQVLRSLELLAVELIGNVEGHGQRLRQITNGLESEGKENLAGVTAAVAQIFDATEEIQQKVESTEQRIGEQAEKVQMQAVLSHTDLLTSLPNRRAFEAELWKCAARSRDRAAYCTIVFLDLDHFEQVNSQYGHQGGDVILRQAAAVIKQLMRGKDLVARYGGDTYALLLSQTTLHDALPVAERVRTTLEQTEFSHGSYPLRLTASLGIAQLQPEETPEDLTARTGEALTAARTAGGNAGYWHDGKSSYPISSAFKQTAGGNSASLVTMFRRTLSGDDCADDAGPTSADKPHEGPVLTGRSLFVANLQRRLSEWKRGGPSVSVIVLHVDQMEELVGQFGATAEAFLRRVMGQLLEAATRDMDERCEFEDGVFAILLPGLDQADALAVAERLQSQVRQCKVRMGDALWNITASIGMTHCSVGTTVVEVMRSAEAAMKQSTQRGGDAIAIGTPVAEPQQTVNP